jgi:hypothetical protein
MTFAPPIQRGIHLTTSGSEFKIALTIKNISDEVVHLRTSSSALFNPTLSERTFSEEGDKSLWSPSSFSMQAVTNWQLPADSTETRHITIPNRKSAKEKAQEWVDDGLIDLDNYPDGLDSVVENSYEFQYVEPSDVGVIKVETSFPAINGYYDTLTRQFDLRGQNWKQSLDSELPEEAHQLERVM